MPEVFFYAQSVEPVLLSEIAYGLMVSWMMNA